MMLFHKIEKLCLSILILISIAETYRRGQSRRPRWYEVEQYSMAMQRPSPRIIGGHDARQGEAPWQVQVTDPYGYKCSGALIAPNAVITAAHCVDTKQEDGTPSKAPNNGLAMYVVFDDINRHNCMSKHKVRKFYFAPNYKQKHDIDNPPGDFDDLVILRLEKRVEETHYVKFVRLSDQFPETQVCKMAQMTGWGHCKPGLHDDFEATEKLQIIWMKMISRKRCQSLFPDVPIGANYICAKCDNGTICAGDSGGPVVIDDKLVGIISFSVIDAITDSNNIKRRECPLGRPAYMMSIKKMLPWIQKVLNELKNKDPDKEYPFRDPYDLRKRSGSSKNNIDEPKVHRTITKGISPFMLDSRALFMSNINPRAPATGIIDAPLARSMWQLSIVTKKHGETGLNLKHYCGGAIIGKRLAITSHYCLYRFEAFKDVMKIRYGGLSLNTLREMNEVVGKYHPDDTEPDCPNRNYEVDILLLELEDDIIEDKFTSYIALKKDPLSAGDKMGAITGWGTFGRDDNIQQENILKMALVTFPTKQYCERETRPPIGEKDHCAHITFATACMSDYGGPITIYENGKWKLVGILTRSKKGCDENYHEAVFVEISKIKDWIDYYVQRNGLTPPEWA